MGAAVPKLLKQYLWIISPNKPVLHIVKQINRMKRATNCSFENILYNKVTERRCVHIDIQTACLCIIVLTLKISFRGAQPTRGCMLRAPHPW